MLNRSMAWACAGLMGLVLAGIVRADSFTVSGTDTLTLNQNPDPTSPLYISATGSSTVILGSFSDYAGGRISATDNSTLISNGFWSMGYINLSGQSHALLNSGSPYSMSLTDRAAAEWRGGGIYATTIGPEASLTIDGGYIQREVRSSGSLTLASGGDGEVYTDGVFTMTGGSLSNLQIDGGTAQILGGNAGVHAYGGDTDIYGGTGWIDASGGSVDVFGGSADVHAYGGDTDLYGGTGEIEIFDGSVDIFGGDFSALYFYRTGTPRIYGSGFNLPYGIVAVQGGVLTGTLRNGQECAISLYGSGQIELIQVAEAAPVPLPAAVWTSLALLGGMASTGIVRRRLRSR